MHRHEYPGPPAPETARTEPLWPGTTTRSGTADIYAQHVLVGGVVTPTWPADGRAVSTVGNSQQYLRIVADGAGGTIMT